MKPVVVVFGKYFFRRGWMEGVPGLFVSVSAGIAVFLNYIRLWEIQRTGRPHSLGGRGR